MSVTPTQGQPEDDLALAKAIITSLQLALKMFTLYAEDHMYCQKSVVRLHGEIEMFLTKFGTLVLEIRSDRILYEGETVHEGLSKDGDLCFALFRDGLLELAFLKGFEPEETSFLVRTIDRYKSLATTAEGDIVTALWEARLPHLYYAAADNILEVEQGKEVLTPKPIEFQIPELPAETSFAQPSGEDQSSAQGSVFELAKQIQFEPISPMTLQLSPEEADKLEEMVRSEEERDATQEIMDMMGDILKDQRDDKFFSYVIGYMLEEFSDSFKRKEFNVAYRIMQTLHHVRKLSEESRPWALSRVDEFFAHISRPEFLQGFKEILPALTAAQSKTAEKVLGLLSPEATLGIGPLLVEVSGPLSEMLSDVLVSLSSKDLRPMEKLLNDAGEPLVFRLVPLLGRLTGKKPGQMLFKLAHYPSERVRLEVLRTIIQRNLGTPEKLDFLLEDRSNLIRRIAIKYFGTRKSEAAEKLLTEHIRNGRLNGGGSGELMACFKALGKCGTERSLPFLEETLLKGGWLSRFRASSLRQGAAVALAQFGTKRSLEILEEAARSRFPAVRNAARAVSQKKGGEP